MKVEFDIPSMQHGARRAGIVSTAVADTAGRVGSLPTPEGTPPDVAGQLHAISATLGRASRSLGSQVGWLNTHAQLARLADSPLGALVWLFSPPLPSSPPRRGGAALGY